MATRITLNVDKNVAQATKTTRFLLDVAKLRGLVEFDDGRVLVSFVTPQGITGVWVTDSYDDIAEAVFESDYEAAVEAGLIQQILNKIF